MNKIHLHKYHRTLKKIILFFFICFATQSQILKDPVAKALILEGLNKAYNFQFDEAENVYTKIKAKYPNNPTYSTLMHMMLYTQYAPITDFPKIKAQYLMHLNKALELSEALIEKNENDPEAIFFMLSTLGSIAAWQADNDEMMKAVNTARKAFPFMKKGTKLTNIQADFLFTTGLYNYYIEQYPDDHPLVKPFMIFFSNGNKKQGLSELEQCSKKAIFTSVESAYYSVYIYLKHENRPDKALAILIGLIDKYPNNILFKTRQAESLISLNRMEAAQPIVDDLKKSNGKIYPVAGLIFQGIIDEKHKLNDKEATLNYKKAIKTPVDIRYTQDYHAMAYLGLGRIALRQGNKIVAKDFFKKALDLSDYTSTTAEAKKYLKML